MYCQTKYHSVEKHLLHMKQVRHFGENRIGFIENVCLPDAEVHFIGTMQSSVKDVIEDLYYLHSLERESVAKN